MTNSQENEMLHTQFYLHHQLICISELGKNVVLLLVPPAFAPAIVRDA